MIVKVIRLLCWQLRQMVSQQQMAVVTLAIWPDSDFVSQPTFTQCRFIDLIRLANDLGIGLAGYCLNTHFVFLDQSNGNMIAIQMPLQLIGNRFGR